MRHRISALLAVLWALPLVAQQPTAPGLSPFDPPGTGGIQVVDRALVKLSTHQRLLIIGAHPDDEDTTLLALVGRGLGGEAAYLSLSRGEGGQNLIGSELGLGLGLIRTGELLAARSLEGTRQYFTRAYDFGYTRSLEETLRRWPRSILLEDAVRAVRRFKPQVIVAIFSGDSRAGHGQHQAAGVVAEQVFQQAGLPDRYPELTTSGMPPWQPQVLYRRVWREREEATHEFALDRIDPLSGRSVLPLAGASRSMHRSQDMGRLQELGRRKGGLIWVAGETVPDTTGVFAGVRTDLASMAEILPPGEDRNSAQRQLEAISSLARETREHLSPSRLSGAVAGLAKMVRAVDELMEEVAGGGAGAARTMMQDLLAEKRAIASRALAAAAGIAVDATTDREVTASGGSLPVTATLWNSGELDVQVLGMELIGLEGWEVSGGGVPVVEEDTGLQIWSFEASVPASEAASVPYFLRNPLDGDLYSWQDVSMLDRGEPIQRAPLHAVFRLGIAETTVDLERTVVYRHRSQADGEVRRPLRAVPTVEVSLEPDLILWPRTSEAEREVEVRVQSHSEGSVRGRIELRGSSGWPAGKVRDLLIDEPFGQQVARFSVAPPEAGNSQRVTISAVVVLEDGRELSHSYPVIDYPHVEPMTLPKAASLEVQLLDLELPPVDLVGYIRGAADRVPEILTQIGLPLELLDAATLRSADLSVYDAIIVGSRAYETDSVLADVNSRLIDYVRQGGLLLVQYQQYQFASGDFAPVALEIARPHGRVTDETAPVEVLEPGHRLFWIPNRLTEVDWHDWVQERGLYFAAGWDESFTPLIALQDEGRSEERGALLVAEVGEGSYIYTGLSFFRQLPAGVPGAIRLFVNLISREES